VIFPGPEHARDRGGSTSSFLRCGAIPIFATAAVPIIFARRAMFHVRGRPPPFPPFFSPLAFRRSLVCLFVAMWQNRYESKNLSLPASARGLDLAKCPAYGNPRGDAPARAPEVRGVNILYYIHVLCYLEAGELPETAEHHNNNVTLRWCHTISFRRGGARHCCSVTPCLRSRYLRIASGGVGKGWGGVAHSLSTEPRRLSMFPVVVAPSASLEGL